MGCHQVGEQRPLRPLLLLLSTLLFSLLMPAVQANLNDSTDGGELFLSCIQDDECYLTSVASGEEIISNTIFASPAQPDTITLEFEIGRAHV